MASQRLQKIIAAAGVTSRRKAEVLITDGRIAVNGEIVSELGAGADPEADLITLDGHPLATEKLRSFVVNKPRGCLCAVSDDRGRSLITDLLPDDVDERLYPAGRLDLDSEGLVLLTNDGALMQAVTKAGSGTEKVYEVLVGGSPAQEKLQILRAGPEIEGRKLMPCKIEVLERLEHDSDASVGPNRGFTRLRVVLREGKKNQIRRMFQDVGHRVERLFRVSIGPLGLGRLAEGEVRELSPKETARLGNVAAEGS